MIAVGTVATVSNCAAATVSKLTLACNPTTGPTTVGVKYTTTCTIAGGISPYNFSVTTSLPAGLTITPSPVTSASPTITISGTPTAAGQYNYGIFLSDSEFPQQSATVNFTGTIAAAAGGNQTYYFSQLTFAGGWQTTLTYINYSPQSVTCITNFYSDTGGVLALPFSQGTISTRTDILPPGGSIHDQTIASLTGTATEGWAQASCSAPVQANILYRLYQTGLPAGAAPVPLGEASLNAETAAATKFVTFAQTNTGVAYANPSTTQSATVTFTVFDETGANLGSTNVPLGPMQHSSSTLGTLLGLTSFVGSVEVTSTSPIISLSLNAEAFPVFSALPPGDLSSSTAIVAP